MLLRVSALLALFAASISSSPIALASSPDSQIIRHAAMRLGHASPFQVVGWLRRQPSVRAAVLEHDQVTVDIVFRDGGTIMILSRLSRTVAVKAKRPTLLLRPAVYPGSGGGRAVVLEPFASELGLGSHAGDPEVSALQSAGFQVDQAYDGQVTVDTMATLAQYNVVYMHTHTGPTGVVATGQLAQCVPYTSPDGTITTVGVAGSNQCYSAVTSQYIAQKESQFPAHSLVFINGCALLNSSDFWSALSSKGVGVFLSWDNDSRTYDDFLSAAAFFNEMGHGLTVSASLTNLYAAGYGHSSYQGQQATLGFRGDGGVTLPEAGASTRPSPTATPTATPTFLPPTTTPTPFPIVTKTPVPSPTQMPPTNTPVPTMTSTPVPPRPTESLTAGVRPGGTETVIVQNVDAGSTVHVTVMFPNGDLLHDTGIADGQGHAQVSFTQGASKITRHGRVAKVEVSGQSPSGPFTLGDKYSIGFGKIDVVVHPRRQKPGHQIIVFVHTGKRQKVEITVLLTSHKTVHRYGKTGAKGWAKVQYGLPRGLKGRRTVRVRADVRHGRKDIRTSTSFTVT